MGVFKSKKEILATSANINVIGFWLIGYIHKWVGNCAIYLYAFLIHKSYKITIKSHQEIRIYHFWLNKNQML